jgi:hypothetical protein
LSTWYDVNDVSSLELDASNRCQLIADKSGNSSDNCLVLPGVSGNYASSTAYIPTGGVTRYEVDVNITNLTLTHVHAAVYNSTGDNRCWLLTRVVTTGICRFTFSTDGTTTVINSATDSLPAGATHWAVDVDWDNGTVDFEYNLDAGAGWEALGTQVAFAPAVPYVLSTAPLTVGAYGTAGSVAFADGNFSFVKIYQDSTLVRNCDNTSATKLAASFVAPTTGETWTINSTAIALPARIHGARDLYMGTAASQPYYAAWEGSNYGYLNGVVGNRFTSPYDATYAITTGSIDIIACVALDNWTPPVSNAIVSRRQLSGIGICYSLRVDSSTGYLSFLWSPDGTSGSAISVTSGVAPTVSNFEKLWIRVFRTAATGAYVFYTSADGVSWTVLASGTGTSGSLFSNTTGIEIGGSGSGTILPTFGKIYSAQVWNGDSESGGTLVASFAASDYPSTGGSTFVSSATGETWTINGGAKIVTRTGLYFDGTADYMKTAPFALSQPENVYFVGEQVTWTSTDYLMDGAASNSGAITQTTSTPRLNISAGTSVAANTGLPVQTAGVVNAVFNGASSSLRINRGTATTGNAGSANMTGLTVASAGTAGTYGNLFLSEALIYDTTAQDTATQDRIALYEGQKWGILV